MSADPLMVVAEEAAAHVRGVPTGEIEVTGDGDLSGHVRTALGGGQFFQAGSDGSRLRPKPRRPAAIIETSGDPSAIVDATERLADGGTLVLAGAAGDRLLTANLYRDVHRRGLVVVGVAPPADAADRLH